jgi:hypothetical protein
MIFNKKQLKDVKKLYRMGLYTDLYPGESFKEIVKKEEIEITEDEKRFGDKIGTTRNKLINYVNERDDFEEKMK